MILKLQQWICQKTISLSLILKKISPFSKIPTIVDHENNESVFESGAILIYLAEKYNKIL